MRFGDVYSASLGATALTSLPPNIHRLRKVVGLLNQALVLAKSDASQMKEQIRDLKKVLMFKNKIHSICVLSQAYWDRVVKSILCNLAPNQ